MIRFVDIRNQKTGYNFAFWDTILDKFIELEGEQAFDNWDALEGVGKTALVEREQCP